MHVAANLNVAQECNVSVFAVVIVNASEYGNKLLFACVLTRLSPLFVLCFTADQQLRGGGQGQFHGGL